MLIVIFLFVLIQTVLSVTFAVMFFDIRTKKALLQKHCDDLEKEMDMAREIQSRQDNIISEAKTIAKKLYESSENQSKEILTSSKKQAEEINRKINNDLQIAECNKSKLEKECTTIKNEIQDLINILVPLREERELGETAFYEKIFPFETTLEFDRAIAENKRNQKDIMRDAVIGESGNKKLDSLLRKISLRAFNSECDLYVASVTYKNVVTFENRIRNSFDSLNKLLADWNIQISSHLYELKIKELQMVYELQEKKQQIIEDERRAKEILRDEIKAEREIEKAKAENEKELEKFGKLLERAVLLAEQAKGEELEKLNSQINLLKNQLEEAKEKEKKISMAQQTKAGYVYVISNIGSFGDNVFKIGMTRRLEPQERIDELGDASVPFAFDVHALIWHENAPELERNLHVAFERHRVNKINLRKEFFKVSLDAIENEARKIKADIVFRKDAEAKEYRQGLLME